MSIISPLTNQPGQTQLSSSGSRPVESVNEQNKAPAKSESSRPVDMANEVTTLTVEEIDETVKSLNEAMKLLERGINFAVDEGSERTVIKVFDKETNDLIKQIPSEDLLKVIEHMNKMQNLLFETKA